VSEPEVPTRPRHDEELRLRIWFLVLDPHVLIYSTIILMTSYALFDEGTESLGREAWFQFVGIGLAPLFALAMAHSFSDALDFQIRNRRRLTWPDRRRLLVHNSQYLFVFVPAIVFLGILTVANVDANVAVDFVLLLGLASLVYWGSFAAHKAKLSWVRQVTFGLSYGFMGFLVLIVELAITH
jgi:hypothetical protein